MRKVVLIDGDILVYKIGFSVESKTYVVDNEVFKKKSDAKKVCVQKGLDLKADLEERRVCGSFEDAARNFKVKFESMASDFKGHTKYELYITSSLGEPNYRVKLATYLPYKGNRSDNSKPLLYNELRELMVNEYGAKPVSGQEADDTLGIRQMELRAANGNFERSVIVSIDKDLRGIPGYHYHMDTRILDFVSEEDSLKNFYGQLLKGDNTDNIPGLTKLLRLDMREEEANEISYSHYLAAYEDFRVDHTAQECYNYVVDQYKKVGFGNTELTEIGRLLWIRREKDQDWLEVLPK